MRQLILNLFLACYAKKCVFKFSTNKNEQNLGFGKRDSGEKKIISDFLITFKRWLELNLLSDVIKLIYSICFVRSTKNSFLVL